MANFLASISGDAAREFTFSAPMLLSDILREAGLALSLPCAGRGRCGKCAVRASGTLAPPDTEEQRVLSATQLGDGWRLACRAVALGDCEVDYKKSAVFSILTEGFMARHGADAGKNGLGAAVDIGTTTLVAYLYDLASGELVAAASAPNPQRAFGDDVISRIEKSLGGQSAALAESVRAGVGDLLRECCAKAARETAEIADIVIAGNTAMMYLLLDKSPRSIATAPFEQDDYFGHAVSAKQLALPGGHDAEAYLVRSIGAYVGGDITAAILSSDLLGRGAAPQLLMDIGTNGEIVLAKDGAANSCSTAAGPAFEGAGISRGMPAASGAISRVWLNGGEIGFETIDDAPPIGICGTGIVDAVAAMLKAGALDMTGRIAADGHAFTSSITEIDGAPAFFLADSGVAITQKDIRAVQLAKSAICAGAETLMHHAGVAAADIETLFIAGGLGSYIDADNAEFIGLIPAGLAQKSVVLGNAAGAGAAMALLSRSERRLSEEIAEQTGNFELSSDAVFSAKYMDGMLFENAVR